MLSIALTGLQTVINQYLKLAHNRDELLNPILGKVVAIRLDGLNLSIYFFFKKHDIELLSKFPGTPDVEITGSPFSLLAMKCSSNQSSALLNGNVTITGNTHVAQQFNDLFNALDIDWEEHLSKIVGDTIAHSLGNLFRGIKEWTETTTETLTKNLSEYVQHEIECFPSSLEVEDFANDIDTLRADFDRLQARIKLLQGRNNP